MKSLPLISTLALAAALGACGNDFTRAHFPQVYNDHYYWAAREAIEMDEPEDAGAYFTKAAENGHYESMGWLGRIYERGTGVQEDPGRALMWYERAVAAPEDGQAGLAKHLGDMYAYGDGTEVDLEKAQRYWRQGLEYYEGKESLTTSEATTRASMYARGQGTETDGQKAIALLQDLYAPGEGRVALTLGDIYYDALGVRRAPEKALTWYTRAAEAGEISRLSRLASMLYEGDGVPIDRAAANRYYSRYATLLEEKQAAGTITDSEVRALAQLYYQGRGVTADGQRAIALLKSLTGKDSGVSERLIGDIYYFGYGLETPDRAQAAGWYERAIRQGDTARLTLLADMYAEGDGIPRDMERAQRHWAHAQRFLESLGDRRSPPQSRTLAHLYANGLGTPADGARAVAILKSEAGRGDGTAERLIGDYYYAGQGFAEPDMAKAIKWYEAAAADGSTARLDRLGEMYAKGQGTPVNKERAAFYWRTAVEAFEAMGTTRATWETRILSRLYRYGRGVPQDQERALALLKDAGADGDTAALRYGGDLAYDMGRMDEARALYARSVSDGDLTRLERYANMVAQGIGGPADADKAADLYQEFVDKLEAMGSARDPYETLDLARMLSSGHYVDRDIDRAITLYKDIAPEIPVAAVGIGDLYYNGDGVRRDYATALQWYQRAVQAGETSRLRRLAAMYERGHGVAPDPQRAAEINRRADRLEARQGG